MAKTRSTKKNDEQTNAHQTNQQKADPIQQATDALNKGAESLGDATGQVLGALQQLTGRFTTTSKPIQTKDAIGKEAEVSVAVPVGGAGEVILSLSGAVRHYPARGKDGRKSFKRGIKVKVVDATTDTLYVDEC